MTTNPTQTPRRGPRRARRVALGTLGAVAALLVVVVVALLVPGVRGLILREALRRADAALPGTLSVERSSWPEPGTIALEGLAWTDSADTLARAERVRVSVGLGSLIHRDLDVRALDVTRAYADIPAIAGRFPAGADTTTAPGGDRSFPRAGALGGAPSIAVGRLAVTADSIVVAPGDVLTGVELEGRADLLHGHTPTAAVERLAVEGTARAWGIETMRIDVDLERGVVDGRIAGRFSEQPVFATLSSGRPDHLVVTVTRREGASPPRDVGARVVVDVDRDGLSITRMRIAADVHTPDLAELSDGLPDRAGVTAAVEATVTLSPAFAAEGTVTVEPNDWLDSARVVASWHDGVADISEARAAFDDVHLTASARVTTKPLRARASLLAAARGYHAGLSADVEKEDTGALAARLSPIVVRAAPIGTAPGVPARAGVVRVSAGGAVSAEDVLVTGDFGEMRVDAALDSSRAGTVGVRARWPEMPAALAAVLGSTRADSLARAWRRDGPFDARIRATLGTDVSVRATLDLPGPRTFASLLPAGADVGDLGNIAGTVDAEASMHPGGAATVRAQLDLGATAWIDTARARVSMRGQAVTVDTLVVAIDSLRAHASGSVSPDSLALAATIDADDVFARRLVPGLPALRLHAVAGARGATGSPRIDADLEAVVADTRVSGRARLGPNGADIRLRVPDGVVTPRARFDTAELRLRADHPGPNPLPADVTVRLAGEGVSFYQNATVTDAPLVAVDTDTLRIALGGSDLATTRPFSVRARDGGGLVVDGLDMSGSLGHVRLDADLGPDSARVAATVSARMPDKPASLSIRDGYWPRAVEAAVRARGRGGVTDSLHADVRVDGITLADGRRPDIRLRVGRTDGAVTLDATVTDADTSLVVARARVPATVTLWPPAVEAGDGDAEVSVHADGIPVPMRDRSRIMRIGADAALSGTVDAPAGSLSVTVGFPDWPKLSQYRGRFDGHIRPGDGGDRLKAGFTLTRGGAPRLRAGVDYTGEVSLRPPFLSTGAGSRIEVHAHSEPLSLDEFDAVLPPDIGLGGTLTVDLDAEGEPQDPSLDGTLTAKDMQLAMRQRLRLTAGGTVRVGGRLREPSATGDVTIASGLIRIPDTNDELLPTSGTARLLEGGAQAPDTTAATREARPAEPVRGDIDIKVTIPGALWIRGRGLDVELAGDLHIHTPNARPTLTGQLRAVRGTMVMLGRNFQLDHGTVVFYGEDTADPSLDVQLSTTIDGTTVTVSITGTASKPQIELTSKPEMEEGDIMSYLVFGRPLDTLDQNQKSLVETRAAEIAAAMGAARLQEELRSQLGIDMVAIQSASSNNQASALVVGKYVNPRLLIKYERLLEEQAAQFINIEYFITRRLKIDTLYGRQDQQGIEIEWSNDY